MILFTLLQIIISKLTKRGKDYMGKPLLSIKDLKIYFDTNDSTVRAVDGVDLEVFSGDFVCVVGESGCGKTITALSIMGLLPKRGCRIANGQIQFNDIDLVKLNEKELSDLRGNEISMIFQEPMTSLNPVLTIGDQITETLLRHRKITKKDAKVISIDMLKIVGVPRAEEIMKEYPHQLSGGLRQRVMITMAMICEPKLLIADEPTTALDVTIQAQVLKLMKDMSNKFHTAVILITHDMGVVADTADYVVVMYAGQIVENTLADELFNEPLHPYTQALLASIPSIDEAKDVLYHISGTVPDAANFPEGCRFADRCNIAIPSCTQKMPQLREVKPDHFVRCDLVCLEGDKLHE
jgi:peptide/nickel transport system ATP-binding protein